MKFKNAMGFGIILFVTILYAPLCLLCIYAYRAINIVGNVFLANILLAMAIILAVLY